MDKHITYNLQWRYFLTHLFSLLRKTRTYSSFEYDEKIKLNEVYFDSDLHELTVFVTTHFQIPVLWHKLYLLKDEKR